MEKQTIKVSEIPESVRRIRNECGMNQTQLAERAGVCLKTVHRLESGISSTSAASLISILGALKDGDEKILLEI